MKIRTTIVTLLSLLAIAALWPARQANSAPTTPYADLKSGMFGGGTFSAVRINVVNVGDAQDAPVDVDLILLNSASSVIKQETKTITPGQSSYLELNVAILLQNDPTWVAAHPEFTTRWQTRAIVRVHGNSDVRRNLKATVEVWDTNGSSGGGDDTFIDLVAN